MHKSLFCLSFCASIHVCIYLNSCLQALVHPYIINVVQFIFALLYLFFVFISYPHSLSFSLFINTYTCVYIYVYVHVYIFQGHQVGLIRMKMHLTPYINTFLFRLDLAKNFITDGIGLVLNNTSSSSTTNPWDSNCN